MINIEELTIKQARELADLFNNSTAPRHDDQVWSEFSFQTRELITNKNTMINVEELTIKQARELAV